VRTVIRGESCLSCSQFNPNAQYYLEENCTRVAEELEPRMAWQGVLRGNYLTVLEFLIDRFDSLYAYRLRGSTT